VFLFRFVFSFVACVGILEGVLGRFFWPVMERMPLGQGVEVDIQIA